MAQTPDIIKRLWKPAAATTPTLLDTINCGLLVVLMPKPRPNWPNSLSPMPQRLPSDSTKRLWNNPAAMWVTVCARVVTACNASQAQQPSLRMDFINIFENALPSYSGDDRSNHLK